MHSAIFVGNCLAVIGCHIICYYVNKKYSI